MSTQKKTQIVLAKTDRMTALQEKVFNVFKSWGNQRFQALCHMMMQTLTESDLDDPDYCLTKLNDRLTPEQEKVFNVFKSWGHQRFQALHLMMTQMFTEEDLNNPDYCLLKLIANKERSQGGRLLATPVYATPTPVTSTPEPVAAVSTIKEETPAEEDEGPTDIFAILNANEPEEEVNNPLAAYVAEAEERMRKAGK